ncbi:MAG: hypothetical protein ABIQ77_03055 [Anaerolineales bacterium]
MSRIIFRGKTYYSVFEMSPNVRRAYEKEQKKVSLKETKEKTEPANDSLPPTFEPGAGLGMRGLVWGILVALVVSGIAFLLSRFIP